VRDPRGLLSVSTEIGGDDDVVVVVVFVFVLRERAIPAIPFTGRGWGGRGTENDDGGRHVSGEGEGDRRLSFVVSNTNSVTTSPSTFPTSSSFTCGSSELKCNESTCVCACACGLQSYTTLSERYGVTKPGDAAAIGV
jgi:hypothetical protein